MSQEHSPIDDHFALPALREVGPLRPLHWLRMGFADLRADPMPSLAYGCLFAIAGDLILIFALPRQQYFMLAVSGFFLIAPLLSGGLYEISRRHAAGEEVSFLLSLSFWRRNGQSLALFGLLLALAALTWERVSAVLFALLFPPDLGTLREFATAALSGEALPFVGIWMLAGGALAMLVFSLSVISVPMLIDREVDMATAAMTSLRAVAQNLPAMAVWAALIVVLTLAGFATLLFGLIVLMPVLGHASWHAYRDLVD